MGLPLSPVTEITLGREHTIVLHQDGTVSGWGGNGMGQLGNGTTLVSSTPVSVIGLPASPVATLAAGYFHTLVAHQDGSVSAWGENNSGGLGNGTTTNSSLNMCR